MECQYKKENKNQKENIFDLRKSEIYKLVEFDLNFQLKIRFIY